MPYYDYKGLDTGTIYEFQHGMRESLEKHPETGEPLQKLISVPHVIIDSKQPKTIESLAEKNTAEMLKIGDKRVKPKKKQPVWRKNKKVDTSLASMSPDKQMKYIFEGKK